MPSERDPETIQELIDYLGEPRSLAQIKKRFGFGQRTAYRWLEVVRSKVTVAAVIIEDTIHFVRWDL